MGRRSKHTPAERFWKRVRRARDASACWTWKVKHSVSLGWSTYVNHQATYPTFTVDGVHYRAHRYSWMLHHGKEIPDGMFVCHTCDNKMCVRPEHLFLGTRSDNSQDLSRKVREAGGMEAYSKSRRVWKRIRRTPEQKAAFAEYRRRWNEACERGGLDDMSELPGIDSHNLEGAFI